MANAGKQQVARCPSPKCGKAIWIEHPYAWCQECGDPLPDDIKARLPKLESVTAKNAEVQAEKKRIERLVEISRNVLVTTTPGIDGHRIRKYLGIESVEFVIETGVFSEVTSSIADFFGARSTAFESKIRAPKKEAMDALKFLAAEQGANAIIGVDLDYCEFSGNRIALIINGTLVVAEPILA
jgi:uncharacterized protein YbjQ (UPF0145 family)